MMEIDMTIGRKGFVMNRIHNHRLISAGISLFCLLVIVPVLAFGQGSQTNTKEQIILRATPGEPVPSWSQPNNQLFSGPKPGVRVPETDAPYSANTNTSRDVWSGSDEPGDYPAFKHSGVADQVPRIAPPQLSLYRNLVAGDPISLGSFGPGQFCVWDTKLIVFGDTNTQNMTNAVLLDGGVSRQLLFKNSETLHTYSDLSTGEKAIEVGTREYMQMIPAISNTMSAGDPRSSQFDHPFFTNTANVGHVILQRFDGAELHFELVREGDFLHGRLTHVFDRFGSYVRVTYQYTTSQIGASNIDDMWKINEIHDRFGPAYKFNYGSSQHSGRWCVESINVLNQHGGTVNYTYGTTSTGNQYDDGKLIGVTYADNTTATYDYGVNSGNTTITWDDPASMGVFGRNIKVHVSGSSQAQGGMLGNQPTGVLVKVTTVDDVETRLQVTHLTHPELLIEYQGTVFKLNPGASKRYATQATDPLNNLEPVYAYNTYNDDDELLQGRFSTVVDERGQVYHYEFDGNGFPIKKIYDKDTAFETYEEWAYGAFYNVTRYRDRLGRVTKFVYNSVGRLLEKQVGIKEVNGVDQNQPEYAVYKNEYYPAGHANQYMLKTEFTPLHVLAETDVHRTDYLYDAYNRVTFITGSAEQPGDTRPSTFYGYDQSDAQSRRRTVVKDPEDRRVYTSYDVANRPVEKKYDDGSKMTYSWGIPGVGPAEAAQQLVSKVDRTGSTDYYTYDSEGRIWIVTEASNATKLQGKFITSFQYYPDSGLLDHINRDSRTTKYGYDYRARKTVVDVFPYTGKTLTTTRVYLENRLHYVEDPYGRRAYVAYNENASIVFARVLQYNRPYDQTNPPANRHVVLGIGRQSTPNSPYTITDYQLDHSGNLIRITDGRGTPTVYTFDSRNRMLNEIRDAGGLHFYNLTTYNKDNTVSSIKGPRFYDQNDTNGYQTEEEKFEYNGRSLLSKRSVVISGGGMVAVGIGGPSGPTTSAVSETEIFYHLDNQVRKHIDARNFEWLTYWNEDDGRFIGRKNPLGNGKFLRTDFEGRATHASIVAQYDTHSNSSDPVNNLTRREITARYDHLDRMTATTIWLNARGVVDPNNPPIAGLDGVDENIGLTTQYVYDTRIFDGQGLDSSAGMSVPQLGGGTWNVNIQECIAKLAEPIANGGAGISFSAGRAGNAVVKINGEEEVSVTILDALGRSVMTAIIEGPDGTNPNQLVAWSCTSYDTVTNVAPFGKLLETKSVDALGNTISRFTDGGHRVHQVVDPLGKITTYSYDADDNIVSKRDPNGVGYDRQYDVLGRMTQHTDTRGDVIKRTYDRAGNVITTTDAKNKVTTNFYDGAGQMIKRINRIGGESEYVYDLTGNLIEFTDAENRTTKYFNNALGVTSEITFPDHVDGSNYNTSGYGKIQVAYDAAVQLFSRTDQTGSVMENYHDLAGRVHRRDYRASAGTGVVDSDTLTYDRVGRLLTGHKGRFNNTITFAYDIAGRKKSESLEIENQTYTVTTEYDVRSLVSKLTYPDATVVERTYTERAQLHQVKYQGLVYDTRTYDDSARPLTCTYKNGVVTTNVWRDDAGGKDNLRAEIRTDHPVSATTSADKVGHLFLAHDANKNITWSNIGGLMNPYGFKNSQYDDEDRLVQWHRWDDNQDQSWVLSLEGDWNSFTEEATTTNRTHNNVHEILSVGSNSLTHDVKGNLTQNKNGHTYVWDFDNQITAADNTGNGNNIYYQYDVLGRRVAKTVINQLAKVYVCCGHQVLMEYDRGTAPSTGYRKYLYGAYIDEPTVMFRPHNGGWAPQYYHRDSQHSVIALTWPSGKVAERYNYDSYGNVTIRAADGSTRTQPGTDNPYLYTGRRWDKETGLYYFRARYYDSVLGRFISRDPSGYPDGLNAYMAYFAPGLMDPMGLSDWVWPWDPRASWDVRDTADLWWDKTKTYGGAVGKGLKTSGKAVVHAGADTVLGIVTLGTAEPVQIFEITDDDLGYGGAYGGFRVAGEIGSGFATAGLDKVAKTNKAAQVTTKTLFVADMGGNAVGAKQGVEDIIQNGANAQNVAQTAGSALGLGPGLLRGTRASGTGRGPNCFVRGTLVQVAEDDEQVSHRKIEDIEVGQRVVSDNPLTNYENDRSQINSKDWCKIVFQSEQSKHQLNITALVRKKWITENEIKIGQYLELENRFAHLSIEQNTIAKVLAIEDCPEIQQGRGQVVLATFNHVSHDVIDVTVENEYGIRETFGVTKLHPFFSKSRNDFVSSGELVVGEKLQAGNQLCKVAKIAPRSGSHRVYNFTVENEHVYNVGLFNVVVHNDSGGTSSSGPAYTVESATSRRKAMDRAQEHAKVKRGSKGGEEIPVSDLNTSSRGRNAAEIQSRGGNLGRKDDTGASVFDHPDGHPDAGKPGVPPHHAEPHVHGKNSKGEEVIVTYPPVTGSMGTTSGGSAGGG